MICKDVRERLDNLWGGEVPGEVRPHLAQCVACRQYHLDLRLLRSGFHLLQREEVPEPSVGFAERLVRRLGTMSNAAIAEFFERVGRRFVYATLVVTFLALLALALPSTGPIRGLTANDIQVSPQEASLFYSDPVGELAAPVPDWAPAPAPEPTLRDEVK